MTRHYTEEEIRRARLVADINNFPELMGAEEDIDCVMVIRVRVWRELDKDYPKLKLYGPSHGEFYEWLINSDQAKTTQFWINLKEKSIKEIYRKYLAEQHKYTRPSEDDLKKFDALMETLKVKELSALTNNGRPNSMDRAEKTERMRRGYFLREQQKKHLTPGLLT